MKYKSVRIFPEGDSWGHTVTEVLHDRIETKQHPHAQGYYYAPASMPDLKALEELRACMVQRHKTEIARLTKSLEALEAVLFLS